LQEKNAKKAISESGKTTGIQNVESTSPPSTPKRVSDNELHETRPCGSAIPRAFCPVLNRSAGRLDFQKSDFYQTANWLMV
jgi:hypothetical protein